MHSLTATLLLFGLLNTGPTEEGVHKTMELESFYAHYYKGKVELSWSINNDHSIKRFVIERSRDGERFKKVMKVPGTMAHNMLISYFDTDNDPWEGISYYRIKRTDMDGDTYYSHVYPVENPGIEGPTMTIDPGETDSDRDFFAQIKNFGERPVLMVLRDENGEEHYRKAVVIATHNNFGVKSMNDPLPSGNYLILASSDGLMYGRNLLVTE